jgi:hypothetical protein
MKRIANLLVVLVVAALSFAAGMHFQTPALSVNLLPPMGPNNHYIAFGLDSMANGIFVAGDAGYTEAVARQELPPRCRNMEAGAGCIDWLEPGETWKSVEQQRWHMHPTKAR